MLLAFIIYRASAAGSKVLVEARAFKSSYDKCFGPFSAKMLGPDLVGIIK